MQLEQRRHNDEGHGAQHIGDTLHNDVDGAAAVGAGLVDGALDGCGVQLTVVGDGAVVQNIDRVGREYGVRNVGQDLFCHVPRQVVGVGSSRSDLAQAILVCGWQAGKEQCGRGRTGRGEKLTASDFFHDTILLTLRAG